MEAAVQLERYGAHLATKGGLEVRHRLVQQEDLPVAHQGATERHTLPLATGELRRPALEQWAEPEPVRDLLHPTGDFGGRDAPHLEPEGDVASHGEVRVQRVGLEHHRDVARSGAET